MVFCLWSFIRLMKRNSKILIVGHNDIIEKSLTRYFKENSYANVFSSSELGLNPTIQSSVYQFFQEHRPEYVFLGSTKSGGIEANINYAADFIYDNLESQNNVIYSSWKFGVKKLLYFASSCIYPKECAQPMKEECLLTGPIEETSAPYAAAKIAGVMMCQAYRKQHGFNAIVAVPATIYGPESDVDLDKAHVFGALLAKFSEAVKNDDSEVEVWGSGNPRREFLHVDDFIDACLTLMDRHESEKIVNIGYGSDVTIKELAELIAQATGFKGTINYDSSKPDGVQRKLLDNSRIAKYGWKTKVSLKQGIEQTCQWYSNEVNV